jgi:NAD(P)H-dependent FMN reductase
MYIPIILGTARTGRQSEKVARYLEHEVSKRSGIETEILDVADYQPSVTDNTEEIDEAKRWKAKIEKADGYIIVSPEYNHGYPGELKKVLDLVWGPYDKKPVAICGVSDGVTGGTRVVEQLRQVAVALRMVPINMALYFPKVQELFDEKGDILDDAYAGRVQKMLEELVWYTQALKVAREK